MVDPGSSLPLCRVREYCAKEVNLVPAVRGAHIKSPSLGGTSSFSPGLQSLRGLAALVVLFGHCVNVYQSGNSVVIWARLIFAGDGAVILFFVLSGFVLARRLLADLSAPSLVTYAIARAFRIYPMLIVCVIMGTIYANYVHATPIPAGTSWYNGLYKVWIDLPRFILSLLGYSGRPAPPLWSIWVEITGSLLLPAFIFMSFYFGRIKTGLLLIVVSWFGTFGFQFDWPVFMISFFIGASIHWWGDIFHAWLRRARIVDLIAPVCVIAAIALPNVVDPLKQKFAFNLLESLLFAPLIAVIYFSTRPLAALSHSAPVYLGDISYSVYLLHFPIMGGFVSLQNKLAPEFASANGALATWLLLTLTLTVTLGLASLTYRFIEQPFIALGRTVGSLFVDRGRWVRPRGL